MTVTSNEEFAQRMMLLAQPAEHFQPTATYDPDGDCIEFLTSPDPFYAERIDDLVTVYYSQETNEVIGSLIKGVSEFLRGRSATHARFPHRNPGWSGQPAAHLPRPALVRCA